MLTCLRLRKRLVRRLPSSGPASGPPPNLYGWMTRGHVQHVAQPHVSSWQHECCTCLNNEVPPAEIKRHLSASVQTLQAQSSWATSVNTVSVDIGITLIRFLVKQGDHHCSAWSSMIQIHDRINSISSKRRLKQIKGTSLTMKDNRNSQMSATCEEHAQRAEHETVHWLAQLWWGANAEKESRMK